LQSASVAWLSGKGGLMLLQDIVQILNNKIESLKAKKTIAVNSGELEQVYQLDLQISETLATLNQLKTLLV
jgi:hypothetical protein